MSSADPRWTCACERQNRTDREVCPACGNRRCPAILPGPRGIQCTRWHGHNPSQCPPGTVVDAATFPHLSPGGGIWFDADHPPPLPAPCCTGIYGSHTQACPRNTGAQLVCWCCGVRFPAGDVALWSDRGSRCMPCEGHEDPCRMMVGATMTPWPGNVLTTSPNDLPVAGNVLTTSPDDPVGGASARGPGYARLRGLAYGGGGAWPDFSGLSEAFARAGVAAAEAGQAMVDAFTWASTGVVRRRSGLGQPTPSVELIRRLQEEQRQENARRKLDQLVTDGILQPEEAARYAARLAHPETLVAAPRGRGILLREEEPMTNDQSPPPEGGDPDA